MVKNIKKYKKIWIALGVLSLFISTLSVLNHEIYNELVIKEILPGTLSQDIISFFVALSLIIIGFSADSNSYKKHIVGLSLVAYLFYGYGIYVIEQIYTPFYLVYMIIFALSFWSIVLFIKDYDYLSLDKLTLPKILVRISLFFSIFIPTLFYFIWSSQVLSLIEKSTKLEFTFSVYILDMVFIMPAFLLIAYLLSKKRKIAYIFAPVIFFKSFTLLFSVGMGSLVRLYLGSASNLQEGALYIVLSLIFLGLSLSVIKNLKFTNP